MMPIEHERDYTKRNYEINKNSYFNEWLKKNNLSIEDLKEYKQNLGR